MYRGRAMGLSWADLGTILPLRTKRSISKFYYGTLKKKMGGDPSPVPNFHDAERRAMKTACGEAQARGEDLDYGLVAEAANEAVDRTLGTYSRYAIHARSDVVNQRLRAAARIQETTAQFARRRRRAQKPRTPPPRKRPRRRVLELSSRRVAPSTS